MKLRWAALIPVLALSAVVSELDAQAGRTGTGRQASPLGQNYPNPFGISTMIRYELPKSSHVNLSVFDLNGRVVKVLVNGNRSAGVHTIRLDGGGLAKGVYYYRMRVGGEQVVKKLVIQ